MKTPLLISFLFFFNFSFISAQLQQTAGPEGGFISSLAAVGTKLFAGTRGAGVFLSTDTGLNWTPVNSGLNNTDITSLAVIGTNLFAGTNNGVFTSTNNGNTWTSADSGIPFTSVYSLAALGSCLFAGTWSQGIYLSIDSGASWNPVNNGLPLNCDVPVIVSQNNFLYAGVNNFVYQSPDSGSSWTLIGTFGNTVYALAVDGDTLFAGAWNGGIFRSVDNGFSWVSVNNNLNTRYIKKVGNTIYSGTFNGGIYRSFDNGINWTSVNAGIAHTTVSAMLEFGTNFFAATSAGVFRFQNNDQWLNTNNGLIATNITELVSSGNYFLAGTSQSGIFLSTDSGNNWLNITSNLPVNNISGITVSGTTIYAAVWDGGGWFNDTVLWKSNDNGTSWIPLKGMPYTWVNDLASKGSILFAATVIEGVFLSSDSGENWTPVNSGFVGNSKTVNKLAISGNYVFACTNDNLYYLHDDDTTWHNLHVPGYNIHILSFAVHGNYWFAGTDNGIYSSSDSGTTWISVNSGLTYPFVYSLISNGSVLFAGTSIWNGSGGVHISGNNGATWNKINMGLNAPAGSTIYALAVSGEHLFAGTCGYGAGIFKIPICNAPCDSCSPPQPFAPNEMICYSDSAILSGAGTGTISWYDQDIGGNYLASGNSYTTPVLDSTSIYYVQDSTCFGSSIRKLVIVTVLPLPIITTNLCDSAICPGTPITLSAQGASTYQWSNSISHGIPFTIDSTTLFTVIGTDTNNCSATASILIRIYPLPDITAFSTSTEICIGDSITLLATGANSYLWSDSILNGVPFFPTQTNVYNVIGTDTNNCSDTASITITVNDPQVIAYTTASSICEGEEATLAASGAVNYIWSGGVLDDNPFIPDSTATYTVIGTDEINCSDTASITITVHYNPTIEINSTDSVICDGSAVTLTATGASSYSWTNGVTNGVSFSPGFSNTYTVIGMDSNSCSDTASIYITVNQSPVVLPYATSTNICQGETASIIATGAVTYQWSDGISNGVSFTPISTNTYTVIGTDENNCSDTATININVNPFPDTTLSMDGATLIANQAQADYQWLNCDDVYSAIFGATDQSYTAVENGNYAVIIDLDGCVDTSECVAINNVSLVDMADGVGGINVFPNPSPGIFTIQSSVSISSIAITNLIGEKIYNSPFIQQSKFSIDISLQPPGIYFLEVKSGGMKKMKKIILQ